MYCTCTWVFTGIFELMTSISFHLYSAMVMQQFNSVYDSKPNARWTNVCIKCNIICQIYLKLIADLFVITMNRPLSGACIAALNKTQFCLTLSAWDIVNLFDASYTIPCHELFFSREKDYPMMIEPCINFLKKCLWQMNLSVAQEYTGIEKMWFH